jgi:hypothetical protein
MCFYFQLADSMFELSREHIARFMVHDDEDGVVMIVQFFFIVVFSFFPLLPILFWWILFLTSAHTRNVKMANSILASIIKVVGNRKHVS